MYINMRKATHRPHNSHKLDFGKQQKHMPNFQFQAPKKAVLALRLATKANILTLFFAPSQSISAKQYTLQTAVHWEANPHNR